MANRLNKTQTAVYVAAVAAIPASPAYCIVEPVQAGYTSKTGIRLSSGSASGSPGDTTIGYVPSDPVNNPSYGEALSGGRWVIVDTGLVDGSYSAVSSAVAAGSNLTPRTQNGTTCFAGSPGSPGTPARTDYLANVGWNAGARSRAKVPAFGEFSGTLPQTIVATQFGLARRSFDHTYQAMTHSIVARQGEWTVVEGGLSKATGALSPGARLTVRRQGSQVTYYANGALLYASDTPLGGDTYGAALLYNLGDAVDSPAITQLAQVNSFSGEAPSWVFLASDRDLAYVDARMPRPIFAAQLSRLHGVDSFYAEAPRWLALASDRPLALVNVTAPKAKLSATLSRAERIPDQVVGLSPPLFVSLNLRSGAILSVAARTPVVLGLAADRDVSFVKANMPIKAYLMAVEPYMPKGEYDGMDNLVAGDRSLLDNALLLLSMDSLTVGTSATLSLVLEMSTMDSVRLADASSFGQLVELLAMDKVAVFSSTSTARHQAIQYAVNALTGAPTTYQGFDFLAFATVDGVSYGVRADGLYRIGDATDNGELIDALIDFGTSDFADTHIKRAEAAYIGVRTDGECYLRVRGDAGEDRVYRVSGEGSVRRSILAKGVAARNWSIKLEVTEASYAEVDSLELLVGATQRHGAGYRTR